MDKFLENVDSTDPANEETSILASDSTAALAKAGQALFQLGRMFDRQRVRKVLEETAGRSVELSRILVVQAVEAGVEELGNEVTVGAVAERLEVDQSTASRLVADTVHDGYLVRAVSKADGRRSILGLTETGYKLAEDARNYQRSVFENLTRGWPAGEREEFARLLAKFAKSVANESIEEN